MKRLLLFCAMLLPIFGASQALGHGGGDSMGDWDAADACTAQKGHYTVHFTAYQETVGVGMIPLMHEIGSEKVKEEFQSYCEGVPKTGKLSMAFDLYHEELREFPISLRIVEAEKGGHEHTAGLESHDHTIVSVPPTVYRDGTARVDTEIPKAGRYIAILKLEQVGPGIAHKPHAAAAPGEWHRVIHTHGTEPTEAEMHAIDPTFSFPFTVGLQLKRRLPWFLYNLGFQAAVTFLGLAALVVGVRYYMNGRRKKPA